MIFSLFFILGSPMVYADKAICTAKNLKTGKIFKATKGKRSYSMALKASKQKALIGCVYASARNAQYCRLTACYRR